LDAVRDFLENNLLLPTAIAIVTVYATLIAPKIGRRGKIVKSFDRFVPIRLSTKHSKVSVTYHIDGREISDDIYVAEFSFKNSGFIDIERENFRQPIVIAAPENSRFLSLEVNSPTETEAEISDCGREISIKWDLLKRNEAVSISAISALPTGSKIEKEGFETHCRLSNVDSRPPSKRGVLAFLVFIMLFPIIAIYTVGWFEDDGRSGLYYEGKPDSGFVIFHQNYTEFRICEPKPIPIAPRSCSKAQPIPNDISEFKLKSGIVGRPLWLILAPFSLAILGIMGFGRVSGSRWAYFKSKKRKKPEA